ncbi:MAG: hypothetical protein ACW99Q_29590, partial [Candidatus Kariarchaeaceae archaeon]
VTSGAEYIEVNGLLDSNYGHSGMWTDTEYRIEATNSSALVTTEDHFRVIGIQLYQNNTTPNRHPINMNGQDDNTGELTFSHNIIRGNGTSTNWIHAVDVEGAGLTGQVVKIHDNLFYDIPTLATSYGIYQTSSGNVYLYNNTIIGGEYGFYRNSGSITGKNNIFQDQTARGYSSTSTAHGWNIVNDSPLVLQSVGGSTTDLTTGSIVANTTDSTYAHVTAVDSDILLTLSADIFDTGNENYRVGSNIYGNPDFQASGSENYLLTTDDTLAMFHGTNLYADADNPVTDDVLGNSRGSSSTDNFDIGYHHLLEYNRVVDPDSGAGYDYTSLNTWESGEQADLTTSGLNKISVATCRSTSGGADDTAAATDIIGWTTEAANYIKIWTDPAESYRHPGIWDDTKYRRVTGNDRVFDTDEDYMVFDGIQVGNIVSGNGLAIFELGSVSGSSNKIEIKNSILKLNSNESYWQYGVTAGASASDSKVYMSNCLFYNGHTAGSTQTALYIRSDYDWYLHNCTIIGNALGVRKALGTGTTYCKNVLCYDQGNSTGSFVLDNGTLDLNYCASDDGEADDFGGTGNRALQTFTFVNSGIGNYELDPKDDGALLYGTNLYTDTDIPITDDIKGVSRGAATTDNYDIGAYYSDSVAHVVDPDEGTGSDYASLSIWESNEQADLTVAGLNKASVATCRSTGGTNDTTATTILGWTTEDVNYIKVWTDPDEA